MAQKHQLVKVLTHRILGRDSSRWRKRTKRPIAMGLCKQVGETVISSLNRVEQLRQLIKAAKEDGGLSYKRIALELAATPEAVRNFVRGRSRNPNGTLMENIEKLNNNAKSLIYSYAMRNEYQSIFIEKPINRQEVISEDAILREAEDKVNQLRFDKRREERDKEFLLFYRSFEKKDETLVGKIRRKNVASSGGLSEYEELEAEKYKEYNTIFFLEGMGNKMIGIMRKGDGIYNFFVELLSGEKEVRGLGVMVRHAFSPEETEIARAILLVPLEQVSEKKMENIEHSEMVNWLEEKETGLLDRDISIIEYDWSEE